MFSETIEKKQLLMAVNNTMTKSNLGRKGFTCFILPYHRPSLKEVRAKIQGRYLEKGTKAQTIKEVLLAYSCFNVTQYYLPNVGNTYRKRALPY